jgi:hypothetical protein
MSYFRGPRTRPPTALASASHEDGTMSEAAGGRRCRPRQAGVLAVTAGLILLTAACSSGSSSSSTSSSGTASHSRSGTSKFVSDELAFAQCVRAHGVPEYPDPNAQGQEPASTKNLTDNPQFPAAQRACNHLISSDFSAQFRADTANYVKFAQCMRAHGVPNFPDPSADPDGSPVFNLQSANINIQAPQVRTAALGCQTQLHLSTLPNYRT